MGAGMIDLDITFFIQLVNFLVTLVVLNLILIRPIREVIRRRSETMAARIGSIEQFTRAAEGKMADYSAQLDAARRTGVEARTELREQGFAVEKEVVGTASQEAGAVLKAARAKISADVKASLDALRSQVNALAQRATARILG
jgi:F-type H+-transporting ATPase subunit b